MSDRLGRFGLGLAGRSSLAGLASLGSGKGFLPLGLFGLGGSDKLRVFVKAEGLKLGEGRSLVDGRGRRIASVDLGLSAASSTLGTLLGELDLSSSDTLSPQLAVPPSVSWRYWPLNDPRRTQTFSQAKDGDYEAGDVLPPPPPDKCKDAIVLRSCVRGCRPMPECFDEVAEQPSPWRPAIVTFRPRRPSTARR